MPLTFTAVLDTPHLRRVLRSPPDQQLFQFPDYCNSVHILFHSHPIRQPIFKPLSLCLSEDLNFSHKLGIQWPYGLNNVKKAENPKSKSAASNNIKISCHTDKGIKSRHKNMSKVTFHLSEKPGTLHSDERFKSELQDWMHLSHW